MKIETITKNNQHPSNSHSPSPKLSNQAMFAFQIIYFDVFGETISEQEAQRMGMNLLFLFKKIYKPIPKIKEGKSNREG